MQSLKTFSKREDCTVSSVHSTKEMKVLFLNCQAFNTAKYDISCLCKRLKIDVLCLNETWEDPNKPFYFENWSKVASKARKDSHGGVAIFVNPDSISFAASQVDLFDRDSVESCAIKIISNTGKVIYLLCAYVPPQQESQLQQLSISIQQANVNNLVLMGDLNGKSPEWNNTTSDRHGDLIEDMLAHNRLIIHNDGQPTRRGGQSVIDLVITSADIAILVKDCSTLTHESVRSDHIAILSDMDIDVQDSTTQTKEVRQFKKVNWHEWRERTEADFGRWMLQSFSCFEEAYANFSNILTSAFNDVIPVKTVKIRNRQKHPCW